MFHDFRFGLGIVTIALNVFFTKKIPHMGDKASLDQCG